MSRHGRVRGSCERFQFTRKGPGVNAPAHGKPRRPFYVLSEVRWDRGRPAVPDMGETMHPADAAEAPRTDTAPGGTEAPGADTDPGIAEAPGTSPPPPTT